MMLDFGGRYRAPAMIFRNRFRERLMGRFSHSIHASLMVLGGLVSASVFVDISGAQEAPTKPPAAGEKARDRSIDVSLAGFHQGVEDAPENAHPLGERFALLKWPADEGAEIPAVCRVAHDYLALLEFFSPHVVLGKADHKRRSLSR
jgi:hypothetical protein